MGKRLFSFQIDRADRRRRANPLSVIGSNQPTNFLLSYRNARCGNQIGEDESMDIGFIGLGRMGAGMAASLQRAGNTLTVYNRTLGKDEELVRAGAKRATRIAEVCNGDAVVTMLADDSALENVVYGEDGLLANLGKAQRANQRGDRAYASYSSHTVLM
jgi:lactate dehydrogenase-like 2-hydroxyacid dehydrogenase